MFASDYDLVELESRWNDLRMDDERETYYPARTFCASYLENRIKLIAHIDEEQPVKPCVTLCLTDARFQMMFDTLSILNCNTLPEPLCDNNRCQGTHYASEYIKRKLSRTEHLFLDLNCGEVDYHSDAVFIPDRDIRIITCGFSIPTIKGLNVVHFTHNKERPMEQLVHKFTVLTKGSLIKCCFIFSAENREYDFVDWFFKHLSKRQKSPLPGAVGFFDNQIDPLGYDTRKNSLDIIAFTVDADDNAPFDCFTMNINRETYLVADEKIRKMAEYVQMREHSIAIFNQTGIRWDVFPFLTGSLKKHFPNTRIVATKGSNTTGIQNTPDFVITHIPASVSSFNRDLLDSHKCLPANIAILTWGNFL